MSRRKNDPDRVVIEEKLRELISEINEHMLNASSKEKLPNYIELGKRLAIKLNSDVPYSNRAISDYMKSIRYHPNRTTRQYEKTDSLIISSYIAYPSTVYAPIHSKPERIELLNWIKENLPNMFVDHINTENGILLIGNHEQFPYKFIERYDKYAKSKGTTFKRD